MGYVALDDETIILQTNFVGAAMLGKERSRVIGQRFVLYVAVASRPVFGTFLGKLRDGADKASCDLALVTHGDHHSYVHIDGVREQVGEGQGFRCRAAMTDITERKAAEELLRAEDRHKSEFLAVLAHELRNPLAPIRNCLYLLDHAPAGSEQAARATAVLQRQTEHLTRLVDDLLDITRISRGKIELYRAVIDAREVVRRTCDDHRSLFEQRGIELRLDHPDAPVWIEADSVRLSQVLGNLLHNAAKFTPQGGTVAVTVGALQGDAEIRVRDTGIGMEPDQVQRMFEPFAQAAHTLARTQGGLGLGLALVKGLVELHGGRVSAMSWGIGRGSEFVVTLSLSAPRAPPLVADAPVAKVAPGRRVLIIEDQVDTAESLAEVLAMSGHQVRLAHDGRTGIVLARELRPDVVICDIGLPDISGYEVARTFAPMAPSARRCSSP